MPAKKKSDPVKPKDATSEKGTSKAKGKTSAKTSAGDASNSASKPAFKIDSALKIDLAETAVSKWLISRTFSMAEVAEMHGITLRELLLHFKNREELLSYYYESRWVAFQTLKDQVPDYHAYTTEEKLSNLIYSILDLISPQKEFIRKTFSQYVLAPHVQPSDDRSSCIRNSESCQLRSSFHKAFNAEIRSVFSGGDVSKTSKVLVATPAQELLWLSFLGILRYWLEDTSKDSENTAALVDKWVSVLAELATSSLGDKVLDLGRFLLRELPLQKIWNPKDGSWKEWDYKKWGM